MERTPTVRESGLWTMTNVFYRGNYSTFQIYENLTDRMNAQQMSDEYNKQKPLGNPYPANSLIIFSIADVAQKSKNKTLINFLHDSFRYKFPHAFSEIVYYPSGHGRVIHNFGTQDEFYLNGKNLIGHDDWIENLENYDILRLVSGTKNIEDLNKRSQSINQTPTYLMRINSKPNENIERVVGFVAGAVRFDLLCCKGLNFGYPSFRVLQID